MLQTLILGLYIYVNKDDSPLFLEAAGEHKSLILNIKTRTTIVFISIATVPPHPKIIAATPA